MAKSARGAALLVLERCRRSRCFSDSVLGGVMDEAKLSRRDRALCSRLCYGVLQNAMLLDFYIDKFVTSPSKVEPKVRDILRISVYQIIFLDRVPDRAAVNEAVELCRSAGFGRAAGLCNAVLRRLSAGKEALPEPPFDDAVSYLSIKYSHPRELVSLFVDEFGSDFTSELLAANNCTPPVTMIANTLRTTAGELIEKLNNEGTSASAHPFLTDAILLEGAGDPSALAGYEEGLFYVQDPAAYLSVLAASPKPGQNVFDGCAAPGGKSFSAAIMMENKGRVLSTDISEKKLKKISSSAIRMGLSVIETGAMDASSPDEGLHEAFDVVIADAPCSGLGVIRKKPDIRYKDLLQTERLPEIQLSILEGLSCCVRPGGTLLYSTCTILRRENEEVVEKFLSKNPDFSPEIFCLPRICGEVENGMITLYPHINGTDGFFICKLRKKV